MKESLKRIFVMIILLLPVLITISKEKYIIFGFLITYGLTIILYYLKKDNLINFSNFCFILLYPILYLYVR